MTAGVVAAATGTASFPGADGINHYQRATMPSSHRKQRASEFLWKGRALAGQGVHRSYAARQTLQGDYCELRRALDWAAGLGHADRSPDMRRAELVWVRDTRLAICEKRWLPTGVSTCVAAWHRTVPRLQTAWHTQRPAS